jgi:hypothetical protein
VDFDVTSNTIVFQPNLSFSFGSSVYEPGELGIGVFTGDAELPPSSPINLDGFQLGLSATDGSDRFIYDNISGLFFDADGTGLSAQVQLATLSPGLALTNANVFAASSFLV